MEWGTSEAVVSIPSSPYKTGAASKSSPKPYTLPPGPAATAPNDSIEEEQEDWNDIDEQLTARQNAAVGADPANAAASSSGVSASPSSSNAAQSPNQSQTSSAASNPNSASKAARPTSSSTSSSGKKGRISGGGGSGTFSSPRGRSTIQSSGYGSASYNPYVTHNPSSTSSLYAAYQNANAATQPSLTKYLGMNAPRTEWLLPTRVSVKDRTTSTMAAKSAVKSPKADKNWKGYIPANQSAAFDLRVFHPKVLDTPLQPLPGSKDSRYDGAVQRQPVSEAQTRASLEKRTEKTATKSRSLSPARLLEEELQRRKDQKKARFELEKEKAKEMLWKEAASISQKQSMIAEERTFVDDLRAKIRESRKSREDNWRVNEIELRRKENEQLSRPEARLAKYERWLLQEQTELLKEQYRKEHNGEEPPPSLFKTLSGPLDKLNTSSLNSTVRSPMDSHILREGEDEKEEKEYDGLGDHTMSINESMMSGVSVMRYGGGAASIDPGRPVENYHGHSGIEFRMLNEADPEANAPLFDPEALGAAVAGEKGLLLYSTGGGSGPGSHSSTHQGMNNSGELNTSSFNSLQHHGEETGASAFPEVMITAAGEGDPSLGGGAGGMDDDEKDVERKYSGGFGEKFVADRTPEHSSFAHGGMTPRGHHREASYSLRYGAHSGLQGVSYVGDRAPGAGAELGNEDPEYSRSRHSKANLAEEALALAANAAAGGAPGSAFSGSVIEEENESGPKSLDVNSPPVVGSPDEWAADETLLKNGIPAMKVPRKPGLFSSAKLVTLRLTHGDQPDTVGQWLLTWDGSSKKKQSDFIQLSTALRSYSRGLDSPEKQKRFGKDLVKKYGGDRAHRFFTLVLADRTLDLVILSEHDANTFDRTIARISHPSGAHRSPRNASKNSALASPVSGGAASSPIAAGDVGGHKKNNSSMDQQAIARHRTTPSQSPPSQIRVGSSNQPTAAATATSASPPPPTSTTSPSLGPASPDPSAITSKSHGFAAGGAATAATASLQHSPLRGGGVGSSLPAGNKAAGSSSNVVASSSAAGALAALNSSPPSQTATIAVPSSPVSEYSSSRSRTGRISRNARPASQFNLPSPGNTTTATAQPVHERSSSMGNLSVPGVSPPPPVAAAGAVASGGGGGGPVAGQAPTNTKQPVLEVDNLLFQHGH